MTIEFFMPMNPPTVTHQEQKTGIRNGKPFRYDPPELKAARSKLTAHLAKHVPARKLDGALGLKTTWLFPCGESHQPGEYRITKPDTDNLQKLLKDCMTAVGFWKDDAQVAVESVQKRWNDVPGIYITVTELSNGCE
ncbi:MAG: RusA family crossover junction endodeoxyribonuclease [Eubacteriales bacterium]|nr:RusA family crossover junction endodeoxyribonuclease [Eubacteriales bacterium]